MKQTRRFRLDKVAREGLRAVQQERRKRRRKR
jgi:hypothetical protein